MAVGEPPLLTMMRAIAAEDLATAARMLAVTPGLAYTQLGRGATRQEPHDHFFDEIAHYVYAGDTALHVAAASYRAEFARSLVSGGADLSAKNRRGAQPLHYAADGGPGLAGWQPLAQAATIAYLIGAGADPNATDNSGVAPLHRAVRTRCAAAVEALLDGGAEPERANRSGSTPLMLASRQTGRGGTGSPESKAQQREIVRLLTMHGAKA